MFEVSSVIEGSKGNVAIVVTMLMSPVVVPVISGLPIAVPMLSVTVLTAFGLIYSYIYSYLT